MFEYMPLSVLRVHVCVRVRFRVPVQVMFLSEFCNANFKGQLSGSGHGHDTDIDMDMDNFKL
jgi:hypothetical protein